MVPDKEKVQALTWLADVGGSSLIYLLEMTGFMSPDAKLVEVEEGGVIELHEPIYKFESTAFFFFLIYMFISSLQSGNVVMCTQGMGRSIG